MTLLALLFLGVVTSEQHLDRTPSVLAATPIFVAAVIVHQWIQNTQKRPYLAEPG